MKNLTPEEQQEQEFYRDARFTDQYGKIWTSVGTCVFCEPERDKYNIYEEGGILLTINTFAYIDGPLMIIPRRHIKSVRELTSEEWEAVRKMMYLAKKLIRKVHDIRGLQFIIRDGGIEAQSTVSDHLHIHGIPFDAPDLSVWNYRKLKYTPLENTKLYKDQTKTIHKLLTKYDEKYKGETA
nr:HIT domain protein [uncultured bacterium]